MNEEHQTIKFTAEFSRESVNFLDTMVKVDKISTIVYTDLYTKDTDTQNYLHYTSSHPIHCKKGGLYGGFLRIRRTCHHISDFETHTSLRISDYLRRGYPKEVLNTALEKSRAADRDILMKEKEPPLTRRNKRIPLFLTFNPASPNMNKIINKCWDLVETSINRNAFQEKPIIAYTRNKNLSDILVRAKCGKPIRTS